MKTVIHCLEDFLHVTDKSLKMLLEVTNLVDPVLEDKRRNLIVRLKSERLELAEAIAVLTTNMTLNAITKEVVDGKQGNTPST